jgi:hypothetical protein
MNKKPPVITCAKEDGYVQEAKAYVVEHFPNNYASADETSISKLRKII